MNITIYTTADSIDPTGESTEEELDSALAAYEAACQAEILKSYPEADIDFRNEEYPHYDGKGFTVSDDDEESSVAAILESVWEGGEWR